MLALRVMSRQVSASGTLWVVMSLVVATVVATTTTDAMGQDLVSSRRHGGPPGALSGLSASGADAGSGAGSQSEWSGLVQGSELWDTLAVAGGGQGRSAAGGFTAVVAGSDRTCGLRMGHGESSPGAKG